MTSKVGVEPMRPEPAWLQGSARSLAGVFVRKGFAATRMDDLVAASGVPRATLYYHFRGKEAVLGWLMRSTIQEVATGLSCAVESAGTGRERLVASIRAMLTTISEHPDACRVLIGNLEGAGRLGDTAEALVVAVYGPLAGLLNDGARDGSLRAVADPLRTCTALFGAVLIAALQALVVETNPDFGLVGDSVTSLLLQGLRGSE